jgi:hypothetical protein
MEDFVYFSLVYVAKFGTDWISHVRIDRAFQLNQYCRVM